MADFSRRWRARHERWKNTMIVLFEHFEEIYSQSASGWRMKSEEEYFSGMESSERKLEVWKIHALVNIYRKH